ncbi:hypothetical protein GWR21_14860 [Chitinophaga agri]|uniref:Uncharacterized protein n=1 Tax=Chitinophaga agri TaxID=2703787 RepID=A0A6B9ZGG2_9BACT|nr:hypothetical protein GWR21_14860 [Chitinophaga agri]
MNSALVMEYIKRRMIELGHGDRYNVLFRHIVLGSGSKIEIVAYNELWVLIEPVEMVEIISASGFFDLSVNLSNELQYEHTGVIEIKSYAGDRPIHVRFVQAVPK